MNEGYKSIIGRLVNCLCYDSDVFKFVQPSRDILVAPKSLKTRKYNNYIHIVLYIHIVIVLTHFILTFITNNLSDKYVVTRKKTNKMSLISPLTL